MKKKNSIANFQAATSAMAKNTSEEFNSAVVVATHDSEFRNFGDKILTMDSGVFV